MAEGSEDKEQKTEQPTQRRLEDARKKGQVVSSKEVTHFGMLLALAFVLVSYAPTFMRDTRKLIVPFLERSGDMVVDQAGLRLMFVHLIQGGLMILALPFVAGIAAAIGSNYIQHGFILSNEPITPKLSKISIFAGFGRMFSLRSVMELIKGIIKITIVGVVSYLAVSAELPHLRQLPDGDAYGMLVFLGMLTSKLMIGVLIAVFFIAMIDYLYQYFEFMKTMRMSKQELKDEYKQQEGDPHIKGKLRQIRAERAKKRMMAEVPKADVVITNPTHFAIALQYDGLTMKAPKVIAKGIDHLALTIRKIATENEITIVENPPLARALYEGAEIDAEIPVEHYQAVAQVIGYVYKLKGKSPMSGPLGKR